MTVYANLHEAEDWLLQELAQSADPAAYRAARASTGGGAAPSREDLIRIIECADRTGGGDPVVTLNG
jgi:hypothetical protein